MVDGCMSVWGQSVPEGGELDSYPLFLGVNTIVCSIPPQESEQVRYFQCGEGRFEIVYCLSGRMEMTVSDESRQCEAIIEGGTSSFFFFHNSEGRFTLRPSDAFEAVCFQFSLDFLYTTKYKQGCLCHAILAKGGGQGDPLWFFVREGMPFPIAVGAKQIMQSRREAAIQHMFLAYKETELLYLQVQLLQANTGVMHHCPGCEGTAASQAYDILMRHLAAPPSLAELAATVGVSKSRLNKLFRSLYGDTVFGIVRQERLKCARRMLAGGRCNVTEVAHECGFSSTSHFSRCFADHYGVGPKQYQTACMQESVVPLPGPRALIA